MRVGFFVKIPGILGPVGSCHDSDITYITIMYLPDNGPARRSSLFFSLYRITEIVFFFILRFLKMAAGVLGAAD